MYIYVYIIINNATTMQTDSDNNNIIIIIIDNYRSQASTVKSTISHTTHSNGSRAKLESFACRAHKFANAKYV